MRGLQSLLVLLALSLAAAGTARGAPLDYRHWSEGQAFLTGWELASDRAKVYDLGPTSTEGVRQLAIKISLDPDTEDDAERNAVLFECGMHAREWYPTESCYWFIDWLLQRAHPPARPELVRSPSSAFGVPALLEHVDVWVIPQTNPAGRLLDDPALGDPTVFARVCKGGADEGDPCSVDADCDSNDCYGSGWRTNANRSDCGAGVDLARNFSSGWASAAACDPADFMKYRGPHPFSELETLNLRRFVHDHSISAVAILHAQARQTWNRWAAHAPTSWTIDRLVSLNLSGIGPNTEAHMPRDSVGGGSGQFSAWLTATSNVAGELDHGTKRNISTFFFELPIPDPDYYDLAYGPHDYQDGPSDGSNTFHPSGQAMEEVWEDSILPMLFEVVRQARSPQCPVDLFGERIEAECLTTDFGLVGAKIASNAGTKGLLRYASGTRREFLASGNRQVVFAVQNFSGGTATGTQATVDITRDSVLVDSQVVPVTLAPGDRGVFSVPHDFEPGEYRVEIDLDGDDFAGNDTKIFAFDVVSIGVVPTPSILLMADPKLHAPGLQPVPNRPPQQPPRALRSSLRFRGRVLDAELVPDAAETGLTVSIIPHVHPAVATGREHPISWQLPPRIGGWSRVGGREGTWAWSDPSGELGPLRQVSFHPVGARSAQSSRRLGRLALDLADVDLAPLVGAAAYTVELQLGGEAILHAIVPGVPGDLGLLEPPEDEAEFEPR